MKKGFTLIELLVVITLIGILAVAVLSALNPIEQINKARDAGRRSDAAQIMSALDRYFASTEEFPWNNVGWSNEIAAVSGAFYGRASMNGVGICGAVATVPASGSYLLETVSASGCTNKGLLVTTEELKSQFGKRKAFRSTPLAEDKFYVIKLLNDPSISVCFVPSSKATRIKWNAVAGQLKSLAIGGTDLPTIVQPCTTQFVATGAGPGWTTNVDACYVCIPEE
ncbi:MAG: type II secretion system protein [Candidatus Beckwithbacteria bacterium]|nr:type II secretion system protein [Candidatus Beckwithbacteria bacterium]